MKKLSVIIVAYNHSDLLKGCLDSIGTHNDIGDALEVIVSDNSPTSEVVDFVREHYPWVKTVKNANIGFGAGNNRGADISEGEYLLFLNPDTVLVEPVFSFAVQKFESDPELADFGVRLVTPEGGRSSSFFYTNWKGSGIILPIKEYLASVRNRFRDGKMVIIGADFFVRKEAFVAAGKFDENIFMYGEEDDLTMRIRMYAKSKKTAYFPEKRIIHIGGGCDFADPDRQRTIAGRKIETEKYVCQKWGFDLLRKQKSKIRFLRFRKAVSYLMLRFKHARSEDPVLECYKEAVKETRSERKRLKKEAKAARGREKKS